MSACLKNLSNIWQSYFCGEKSGLGIRVIWEQARLSRICFYNIYFYGYFLLVTNDTAMMKFFW